MIPPCRCTRAIADADGTTTCAQPGHRQGCVQAALPFHRNEPEKERLSGRKEDSQEPHQIRQGIRWVTIRSTQYTVHDSHTPAPPPHHHSTIISTGPSDFAWYHLARVRALSATFADVFLRVYADVFATWMVMTSSLSGPKLFTPIVFAGADLYETYGEKCDAGCSAGAGSAASRGADGTLSAAGAADEDDFDLFASKRRSGGGGGGGGGGGLLDGIGAACACNCAGFAPKSVKRAWQLVLGRSREDAVEHVTNSLECKKAIHCRWWCGAVCVAGHRLHPPTRLA